MGCMQVSFAIVQSPTQQSFNGVSCPSHLSHLLFKPDFHTSLSYLPETFPSFFCTSRASSSDNTPNCKHLLNNRQRVSAPKTPSAISCNWGTLLCGYMNILSPTHSFSPLPPASALSTPHTFLLTTSSPSRSLAAGPAARCRTFGGGPPLLAYPWSDLSGARI